MADINTVDNAILGAKVRLDNHYQKWMAKFFKPMVDATQKLWYSQQPPEVIAKLREMTPEAMEAIEERI